MSATPLPRLIDIKGICEELGVKRHMAEKIVRHVPKQEIPGARRILVRRDDVLRVLDEHLKDA